jgi:hypothetical protein
MRKLAAFCLVFMLGLTAAHTAFSQDPARPEVHFYRLDFVLQELGDDGKPVNNRSYSATVSTEPAERCSIRSGTRIPLVTGDDKGTKQIQYIDLGVSIDIQRLHEVNHQLAMSVVAEISSLGAPVPQANQDDPVIRQTKGQNTILAAPGKATNIVFTSDNLDNKGRMQLTVTVTPLG